MGYGLGWRISMPVLVALLVAAATVRAGVPALRPGQGLLVLAVSTDVAIDRLRVERLDGPFAGWTHAFAEGESIAVRPVPAGRYRIALTEFEGGSYIDWPSRADLEFDVRAGTPSYPGTLEVRRVGISSWSATLTNRAARAIGALERMHGAAAPSIEYTGRGPDPFPQLLRELRAATPGQPLPAVVPYTDEPAARGIPAATLFDTRGVATARISPDGRRIADASMTADGWRVAVLDLDSGEAIEVYSAPLPVTDIAWASAQGLVIGAWAGFAGSRAVVVRFDERAGAQPVGAEAIPFEGRLLSRVRGDPGRIVFLRQVVGDEDPLQLHRVSVEGRRIRQSDFRRAARLDAGLKDDSGWLIDGAGTLRIAITGSPTARTVMFREGNARMWRALMSIDGADTFVPVAMAADGLGFDAVTDHGRAQRDLLRYRIDDMENPAVVHSISGVDIENAIVRPADGAVIGVHYLRDGHLEPVYFDEGLRSLQAAMRAALPGRRVAIVDRSDDGQRALVLASGPTDPGTWYLLDRRAATLEPLGRIAPHLADLDFREPRVVQVPTPDGATVQAILTLPDRGPAEASAALVVMPHGGPIAVVDSLEFDRTVQYLAARGFAVLQVNYRGSDGFGRAFREAGMRSQGRGIEDDIEAAIDYVLARFPLDRARVALAGASYGGYSALMGLVRAPERFRCAVSISGVSDIPLQFTSSDSSRDPVRRALLARIWGDPLQELDALRQVSPVYRGDAIRAPVLLVHGLDDERVVSEHSERMRLVLQLRGAPVSTVAIQGEGHALSGRGTRARVYGYVAAFLDRCFAAPGR